MTPDFGINADQLDSTKPVREQDVLRRSLERLRRSLPEDWVWAVEEQPRSSARLDAVVTLASPDGQRTKLIVEAKRLVASRDIPLVLEQLRANAAAAGVSEGVPLVVARYLSPDVRERLERAGAAYADATGNSWLRLDRPALFVRTAGKDQDPWRGPGRPRGSLKGAPAARVVRWLADFQPPYTPLEIVKGSGASKGATYRVLTFLAEEGLVEREPRGRLTVVRWRQILNRWSRDSGFQQGETAASLLFPRGVENLVAALRSAAGLRYAVTGSLAARHYAPFAPVRFAMLYADDVEHLIDRLELRRVDTGANVLVAPDRDDVAFERTSEFEGVRYAAPSQIAVDLLTGPGRSPSEAEALLDWMETNERAWRR